MTGNFLQAVAVLRGSEFEAAEAFYCDKLGCTKDWAYQPDENRIDPTYAGLSRDGASLHVSSFTGDGVPSGVPVINVRDVDELHPELAGRGVMIDLEPTDQTWGDREMYVKDGDGNSLRFCQLSNADTSAG